MKARLIGLDAPEWSALRETAPHDVFDGPAYVGLSAQQARGRGGAVYVEHEDGRRLLVPIVIRDVTDTLRDASSPYGYPGILTDAPTDATFVRTALEAALVTLREEGIVTLFLRLHPLLPVAGLDGLGTMVRQATVAVDLSKPVGQLWAETRLNHRRDIKRARQLGFTFCVEPSLDSYDAFQQMYDETMERLDAAHHYRFPKAYFERLPEAMEGRLRLATVTLGDRLAAGGLITTCDGIVQSFLIASANEFTRQGPTKMLYHGISTWAQCQGERWFHLGGGHGSDEDSLFHFKAGFSRMRNEYATLRVVVRTDDYHSLMAGRKPEADTLDLEGYFPRYRE